MSTVQSRKAKGRRLQQDIVKKILDTFPELTSRDVRSTSMGACGVDVVLSQKAHDLFPFSVECKNQEVTKPVINMWKQTEDNTENGSNPLLIIHANGTKTLAIMDVNTLFDILKVKNV